MWKRIKLKDIFSFDKKSTIKAGAGLDSGKYKFFTCSPIQNKYIDIYLYENESIIIGTGGNASIHYCNEKFSTSTDCFVINIDNKQIMTKYAFYFLLLNISVLGEGFRGVGLKHISKEYVQNIEIPIPVSNGKPNIDLQIKIISIFDKQFEVLDIKKKQIDSLDKLLQDTFIEMFGDPIENPKGWTKHNLNLYFDAIDPIRCGPFGSALKKDDYIDKGISVLTMDNILTTGDFFNKINLRIPNNIYNKLKSYSVQNDDIIISRAGTVGKMCVVENLNEESIISTNLIRLRLNKKKLLPIYFVSLMKYFSNNIIRLKVGEDTSFTHMSSKTLNKIQIYYPPIALQINFAQIYQLIKEQKKKHQEELKQLNILSKALAEKCFNGEFFNEMSEVNEVDSIAFDDKIIGKSIRINDAMPIEFLWRKIIQEYSDNQISLIVACKKLTKLIESTTSDKYNDIFDFVAKNIEQSIRMSNSLNNLSKKLPIIKQLHDKYLLQYKKRAIDTLTDEEIIETIKMYLVPGSYVVEMFSQFFDIESVEDYDELKIKLYNLIKKGELDQQLDRDEEILKSESADINDRLFLSKFMTLTRVK